MNFAFQVLLMGIAFEGLISSSGTYVKRQIYGLTFPINALCNLFHFKMFGMICLYILFSCYCFSRKSNKNELRNT